MILIWKFGLWYTVVYATDGRPSSQGLTKKKPSAIQLIENTFLATRDRRLTESTIANHS